MIETYLFVNLVHGLLVHSGGVGIRQVKFHMCLPDAEYSCLLKDLAWLGLCFP